MRQTVLAFALALAGCAASPAAAPAGAPLAAPAYASWSCPQLQAEATRLDGAVAALSARQDRTRTDEVAGVLFLGKPVSSLDNSDHAAEMTRLRTQQDAVRQAQAGHGCPAAPPGSGARGS